MARYVVVSSNNLLMESLQFVVFDNPFDRPRLYGHFNYPVEETIFERRLSTRGNNCCFNNCHSVDVYAISSLIRSGLFVPVPDWWRAYEFSRFLFVRTPIALAYYSNLVIIS